MVRGRATNVVWQAQIAHYFPRAAVVTFNYNTKGTSPTTNKHFFVAVAFCSKSLPSFIQCSRDCLVMHTANSFPNLKDAHTAVEYVYGWWSRKMPFLYCLHTKKPFTSIQKVDVWEYLLEGLEQSAFSLFGRSISNLLQSWRSYVNFKAITIYMKSLFIQVIYENCAPIATT